MKMLKMMLAGVAISLACGGASAASINVYDGMLAQEIDTSDGSLGGDNDPMNYALHVSDTTGATTTITLVDTTPDTADIKVTYSLFDSASTLLWVKSLTDTNTQAQGQPVGWFTFFLAAGDYVLTVASLNLATNGSASYTDSTISAVPLPAAAWLFGSAALGMLGFGRRRKQADVAAV